MVFIYGGEAAMKMVGVDTRVGGLASHKCIHDKEVGLGCGNPIGTNMEAQSISHTTIYHVLYYSSSTRFSILGRAWD